MAEKSEFLQKLEEIQANCERGINPFRSFFSLEASAGVKKALKQYFALWEELQYYKRDLIEKNTEPGEKFNSHKEELIENLMTGRLLQDCLGPDFEQILADFFASTSLSYSSQISLVNKLNSRFIAYFDGYAKGFEDNRLFSTNKLWNRAVKEVSDKWRGALSEKEWDPKSLDDFQATLHRQFNYPKAEGPNLYAALEKEFSDPALRSMKEVGIFSEGFTAGFKEVFSLYEKYYSTAQDKVNMEAVGILFTFFHQAPEDLREIAPFSKEPIDELELILKEHMKAQEPEKEEAKEAPSAEAEPEAPEEASEEAAEKEEKVPAQA